MLHQTIELPGKVGTGKLVTYIHDETHRGEMKIEPPKRPFVIVVPGGSYRYNAPREGEPMAVEFFARGCNVAVLWYQRAPEVYFPAEQEQLARAILKVREMAQEWLVEKVVVCGFSAGGHLVNSLGVLWDIPELKEILGEDAATWRPDGVISGYGVTSLELGNLAAPNLLGENNTPEMRAYMSVNKHVTEKAAPVFIWCTYDDPVVSVKHALLLADAYTKAGRPMELHIFPHGHHGLATCNAETDFPDKKKYPEAGVWLDMAMRWIGQIKE